MPIFCPLNQNLPKSKAIWPFFAEDTNRSKQSYKRGCQEKILPLPLPEERGCGLHPAQSQFWRGRGLAAYSGQTKQLAVCTRRFHDAMVIRRLRFWRLRKQTRWL